MGYTRVVNIHRAAFDVYIGRPSIFGNPYILGRDGDRWDVIDKHRRYFLDRVAHDPEFRKAVEDLRGKVLGCFCKRDGRSMACHGDVIAAHLNGECQTAVVEVKDEANGG